MNRILFCLLLLAGASVRADEYEWRVPFITTPGDVVERMLEMAGTGPNDLVADLGSGDGRIVIAAARRFGARGLGIELDEKLARDSRDNARTAGVADKVSIVQGDVLTADFSRASVVTVYLLPGLIEKLQSRFIGELKPGTRIVSHAFRMTGWPPDRAQTVRVTQPHTGQGDESTLYLWVVPADVRGQWTMEGRTSGGRSVRIEQNYQQIDVEGANNPRLDGAAISWQWSQGQLFRGRVEGERIVGDDGVVLTRRR